MPFVHMHMSTHNDLTLCCSNRSRTVQKHLFPNDDITDVWKSDFYRNVREQVLNDEIIDGCEGCFELEALGKTSDRLDANKKFESIEVNVDAGNKFEFPISFDLRNDNTCNLKCVVCGPFSSSQIAKEIEENKDVYSYDDPHVVVANNIKGMNMHRKSYISPHLDKLRNIDYPLLFRFLGGEPSLIPEHTQLLDFLIETNKLDASLFVTTNLTNVKFDFYDKIDNFRDSFLHLSLDGVGKPVEYIRGPLDWQQWLRNFNKLRTKNILRLKEHRGYLGMGIIAVASALNWYHLPEFIEFWINMTKEPDLKDTMHITFIPVHSSHASIENIPIEDRLPVIEKLTAFLDKEQKGELPIRFDKLAHLIEVAKTTPYKHNPKFVEDLAIKDIIRNRNIKDYIPEVYELIKDEYEELKVKIQEHRKEYNK